ncbi:hypothetical protein B0H15DRAFT_221043 [Mycena belliarum]|uniref:T6SS Phospholipase effector Tle1-like catalytic domain-containing protein n=1 Tax=Mycena belliarum TaxID=1033014 RepID=A0AAD6UHW1_9AGAR|nr:hypothetical protein B0H15DRAFT_221043 [Mycena belliae]
MSHSRDLPNSSIPHALTRVKKRIIVCCDGTWQDGVSTANRQSYTNILRLARTINHEDSRFQPALPQIVFYQSGIGSDKSLYSEYIVGTTGATLADKVEECYGFISSNYYPGDEIFLFGFSRGAYTARMVAMFIGEIGVLDRTDMDHFAGIFLAYQKLGKSKDEQEIRRLKEELAPWTGPESPGKRRADSDNDSFSIKFVGVYETVGSLGLPEEITLRSPSIRDIFGFPNTILGSHIQYAYQALALNEPRADFNCCKFEQSAAGLSKGQVLRQCWFTGCHSDVGGGYKEHDLADLTLFWMAANVQEHLSLDYTYLGSLPHPSAQWGTQPPHNPATRIFALAHQIQRTLPSSLYPNLATDLSEHPELVAPLLPLEDALRRHWTVLTPTTHDMSSPLSSVAGHAVAKDVTLAGKSVGWLGKFVSKIESTIDDTLDD